MHYRFDPQIFIDQPLTLAGGLNDDYRVAIVGRTAGRIFKTMRGSCQHV